MFTGSQLMEISRRSSQGVRVGVCLYGAAIARGTSPHIPKVFGFEAREHSSPYTQRTQLRLQSLSFTVLGAMSGSQHNLAVLISGNGSNLQALIDACATGTLPSTRVSHVISK